MSVYFLISSKTIFCQAHLVKDSTFGVNGWVDGSHNAVVVQMDGKVITGGAALTRYNVNGTLDTSFNTTGKVSNPFGILLGVVKDVAIQEDGKIVVVGYVDNSFQKRFSVARFKSSGTLDSSFGTAGIAITQFAEQDQANCVVIKPDSSIIVGGGAWGASTGGKHRTAIAKYKKDGSLDSSFAGNGLLITNLISNYDLEAAAIALRANGEFVLGASYNEGPSEMILAMFKNSGTLDSSYGGDGIVETTFWQAVTYPYCTSVAIQTDGKIVAAGTATGSLRGFVAVRYKVDGSYDNTFGQSGVVFLGGYYNDPCRSIKIQQDGKIVLGGRTYSHQTSNQYRVDRINPDGSLDATGIATGSEGYDLALGQNRIYLAGNSGTVAFSQLSVPVPLHLLFLTASLKEKQVYLNWRTTNEVNTSHFDIQRSLNGREFAAVGTLKTKDNSLTAFYNFTDDVSSISCDGCRLFYRLKMVDKDASFTYSDVQKVTLPAITMHVVPNPAGSFVRLTNINVKTVEFYDSKGSLVLKVNGPIEKTINVSTLPRGIYSVICTTKQDDIHREKLVLL